MAGTIAGGKAAAKRNKELYGSDFYAKIGAMGGKLGTTGGFYAMKKAGKGHLISEWGRLGGLKSRRGRANNSV